MAQTNVSWRGLSCMSLLSPNLTAFIQIARLGTVHAAAEQLHLTQTAVTQRLKSLEQQLGVSLFIRSRRGMALTPEGKALLRYCQNVQTLEGEALAQIQGSATQSAIEFCLMGPSSVMDSRIMPALFPLTKRFSNLLFEFVIEDQEIRLQALKTGRAQLAVIREQDLVDEIESKELQPEQYVLVAPAAWHKRQLNDIIKTERIIDFNPQDDMTFNYLKHFNLFEHAHHERYFVNQTTAMAQMVAAGCGYSVLTKEFAQHYVQQKQLIILNQGKTYQNKLLLAWYQRLEMPAYFQAILDSII